MTTTKEEPPALLWGDHSLSENQTTRLIIGPLTLYIQRLAKEWSVIHNIDESGENTDSGYSDIVTEGPPYDFTVNRFVLSSTENKLRITPLLADRPVVVRPETPLHIPAGQNTTLFVSTPLWIQIQVNEPLVKLLELPITQPSDTWFGASTMEGELCYASTTLGLLNLENFPHLPHRAVTPVHIHNNSDETFQLERLNISVPYLSLYYSSDQHLWTEAVTMVRESDTELASLIIAQSAPQEAGNTDLISEPRKAVEERSFISKVSALFG